ncbi:hypothetical protein [Archangium lansingense]|uniref:Ig-like domain-containing protein n=1 Tax=Archangium lansingense TaxID=2995310 RepID=A0ABT4ARZ4_9BACT|nr:hypothetical protein [Archangium lansinium]MCY1083634.1 hypothetical protein [Archangium lansinium]
MTQPSFPRRGVLAPLALVLLLGLGPPAAAQVTVSARESLLLQVGERRLQLRVESDSISGGGFQLRRVPNGLRGTFKGQPVDLKWNKNGDITGQAAGASVELTVLARAPQPGLSLRGWFGADTAELTLTPTGISGSVGGCSYSLAMAGNRYSGWRTCDVTRGPPESVTLRIPEDVVPLGPAEEGALLALLLSGEALPPAPSAGETPGVGGSGTPSP